MDNKNDTARPAQAGGIRTWMIWVVGLVALIWHGLGCLNFVMQLNPEALLQMPESHRAIAEQRPFWATAAFGLSVFTGVSGALLLLLRRRSAFSLFVISLIGAVIATFHGVTMANALSVFSPVEILFGVVGPIVLGVFLVWFCRRALP